MAIFKWLGRLDCLESFPDGVVRDVAEIDQLRLERIEVASQAQALLDAVRRGVCLSGLLKERAVITFRIRAYARPAMLLIVGID